MGNVIIPKHTAELVYFDSAMKILSDAKEWILMGGFTDRLFNHLKAIGKETTRHSDNTHYTKCAQLPLYFGFAERNVVSGKTYLRISFAGQAFYDASKRDDISSMHLLIVESLEHGLFGEENDGVPSSRSDVDAPNLFVRASYDLEGLSNKEFAYILWSLVDKNDDYTGSVNQIRQFRKKGVWDLPSKASNYQDCKPIMILSRWKFLTQGSNGLVVNPELDTLYHDRFLNLKIYSVDRNINHGSKILTLRHRPLTEPIQLITYGAPGTGKSWKTDKYIKDNGIECFRTTFHPDSDYSTFVGAYKPTMKTLSRVVQDGTTIKHPTYAAGVEEGHKNDDKIVYEFRPQAFMKAYVAAWKNMGAPDGEDGKPKPVFLVIEEINRGNCAQIFGDIFQLLDRDENGWSSYPINADTDLTKHLKDNLPDLSALACPDKMKPDDWDKVKAGEMLALPPNLYIHATMNTSDQSLFPIDSAFKRRWDWRFIPISKPAEAGWVGRKIQVGGKKFDWWDFISIINEWILDKTKSEDKHLGYFFVKAPDATGIITGEQFANKVLFYIYNDVFKDYDLPRDVFGKENSDDKYKFKEFFTATGDVNETMVAEFLSHLKKGDRKIGVTGDAATETPPSEETSEE